MRNLFLVFLLFLIGCASDNRAGTIRQKRELGKGFHTVAIRTELPAGGAERFQWAKELYYKNKKIDETLYAFISPTGRYAVYESMIHRGVVLFDTKKRQKYRAISATVPTVEAWGKQEEFFVLSCYLEGKKQTIRININELKVLEE